MDLEESPRRRRGTELEDAILTAAWEQLAEGGHGAFTIDAVAERAGTSRSVIYRRWPDRQSLLRAALGVALFSRGAETPDTGSLREDMLEIMRRSNQSRAEIIPLLSVLLGAYFSETGGSLQDIRHEMMGDRVRTRIDDILDRAVARGEADPARLTPRVRTAAFDLFRNDLMLTFQAVPEEQLVAIVDEVFLPLVQSPGTAAGIP